MQRLKTLILNKRRNFLVITQVANALLGMLAGKLIAMFVLPEDFGLYNLQFAAFTFFFSLLVEPSLRFVKASYDTLIPKIGFNYFGFSLLGFSVILFLSLLLFFSLYKPDANTHQLFLIFVLLIPLNVCFRLISDQFTVLNKIKEFSLASVLKSIAGIVFIFIIFYFFNNRYSGSLTLWNMQLIGWLFGMIFLISKYEMVLKKRIVSFKNFTKKQFRYTWPLMFMAIWSWINNYFDRFVIDWFLELEDVGLYNANYSLGSKFFLLINPIFLVLLTPHVYKNNKKDLKKKMIKRYSQFYFLMGAILLALIYFLTDEIGHLLLSESYREGFYIIFWISLGYLVMTVTYLYESIFYAENKTKIILHSNIIAALVNVALNVILLPYLGLAGAALATVFSMLLRFAFIYFKFRKI